ncbi:CML33 [Symbiodinium pilosum]|uniref:CML33 protein n=1 Tax=Symbiodinium pilosum TaxID=2952 RepID=A0A812JQZ4_SYMPI|nr:CML33 [Symbiodinium pilosum]
MPAAIASPYWFSETFGFSEEGYDKTKEKFVFADDVLESKATGRRFHVGPWALASVQELRTQCEGRGTASALGGLTFSNVCGNAQTLHRDPTNVGSVFQVASQFNCLEMNEPGARPEDGVTRYYSDATQGPACAISCPAGTVFRNYFVNGKGQGRGHQLDGLADIAELVGNSKEKYWRMVNGYCLPVDAKSIGRLSSRLKEDEKLSDELRSRLRIGVHWDTEVANKDHRVCQVFCSALPVAYAKSTRSQDWEAFGRLVLQGTFEATLAAGAVLAAERGTRIKVYLSAVGGGAFGNRTAWIVEAIDRALRIHADSPLDVMLVHFGTVPRGAYADLAKGRKTRPAPKPAPKAKPEPDPAAAAETAEPVEPGSESKPADAPAPSLERTESGAVSISRAFAKIDTNNDGVISEADMKSVLKALVPSLSDEDIKAMFVAADSNSDGEVHYAEFAAWITSEDASSVMGHVLHLAKPEAPAS